MGEASMYDCIFLILLFYMYICILYVDILSHPSIHPSIHLSIKTFFHLLFSYLRLNGIDMEHNVHWRLWHGITLLPFKLSAYISIFSINFLYLHFPFISRLRVHKSMQSYGNKCCM